MERKITIIIDPMGNPTIEGHNFEGESCAEKTAALEKALASGEGDTTRELKPSWYETENAAVAHEVHN